MATYRQRKKGNRSYLGFKIWWCKKDWNRKTERAGNWGSSEFDIGEGKFKHCTTCWINNTIYVTWNRYNMYITSIIHRFRSPLRPWPTNRLPVLIQSFYSQLRSDVLSARQVSSRCWLSRAGLLLKSVAS